MNTSINIFLTENSAKLFCLDCVQSRYLQPTTLIEPIDTTSPQDMADSDIPWSQVRALSFDIYGTLIDWESGIVSSARATALGPHLPGDRRKLLLEIERHDTAVQQEKPTMRQTGIIAEGLRRYAQELKVVENGHLTEEQVEHAVREYSSKIGTYPAFPDTVRAIQRLAARFKLIPVSNVDRASFSETLSGPLHGCKFDAIYTAEDIGSYKPDLRNFEYLLDHVKADFGVEKDQLCHIRAESFPRPCACQAGGHSECLGRSKGRHGKSDITRKRCTE